MSLTVLHLAGSPTSAFHADLSRLYAAHCLAATADPERYAFQVAWVAPDGSWRFPASLDPADLASAAPRPLTQALREIEAMGVDVVVPQMFCLAGMTHYRALLELLALPYLGNRPATMAMGADKAQASAVVAARGVRVPASVVVRPGETVALEPPLVVKPVDADNSLGLTLVRERSALAAAVEEACAHSPRALVETYVELGREVRCGVLEVDGELVCLPLEEYAVDAATKPVRDRADKLRRHEDGSLGLVAKDAEHAWVVPLDDPVTERVHAAARRCYAALGCRHYGLFDFRVDPAGEPFFLEASLYCSYAPTSVLAVMADAAGIGLAELFDTAVEDAVRAHAHRPATSPATSPAAEE